MCLVSTYSLTKFSDDAGTWLEVTDHDARVVAVIPATNGRRLAADLRAAADAPGCPDPARERAFADLIEQTLDGAS